MAEDIAPIPDENSFALSPPHKIAIFSSTNDTDGLFPLVYIELLNGSFSVDSSMN